MRLFFILIFLAFVGSTSAQKIVDSLEVYDFPVHKGVIYNYDQNSLRGCTWYGPIVTILTNDDSLFHFENGKIVSVFDLGDGFAIVIQNSKNEHITYSNLKTVAHTKGDIVNRGMFLGTIVKNEWGGMNEMDMLVFKGAKELPYNKLVDYIKCSISSGKKNEILNLITNTF